MYDIIVIGARCAGAPTAMLLARRGYHVLLVDRATFPSDIPHGHFIHRSGPARLARWGLLDRIVSADCPPIAASVVDLGDFPLEGRDLVGGGVAFGYGPRRSVLDAALVDAAVEAGVELRDGFAMEDVVMERDRVVGIRGRTRKGVAVTEHARLTIGADGRSSRLAAAVDAPMYNVHPPAACWYFSYWSGVNGNALEVTLRDRTASFVFPTSGRRTAVFVGWPIEDLPRVRGDIEGHFMRAVEAAPPLADRLRAGRREERFYGAVDLPNFYRRPYGPGWALVGDAGLHKDPYLALGICDAFRDVDYLVDAVDSGLSAGGDLPGALARYERRRNEASDADYQRNLSAARFERPPEEMYRIRAAIRGDRALVRQFFLANEGMIPPEAFFNPENLSRLLGTP